MEQKQIFCGYQLPTMSVKYPWLVAQNLEANTKDQIFYTMHDQLTHYRCQIPELVGRRIRGCFHGWVILSDHPHNVMWSLWNPVTSKTVHLPPLTLKNADFESIKQGCLSSPPNNPTSVLILTRTRRRAIVFCHLDRKRKSLRWKEMTYAKQLRNIAGDYGFLHCLTCCNGKVYALNSGARCDLILIQLDIVAKDKEVEISLIAFGKLPSPFYNGCSLVSPFLKGYCKGLFFIKLGFADMTKTTVAVVYLFKLDTTSMIWEEMEDLKDAIFFVDLAHGCSVYYRDAIASGGYIHINLGKIGNVVYSYDVKDKTISLSSMPWLEKSAHLSLWECRLPGDREFGTGFKPGDEVMVKDDEADNNATRNELAQVFNIPLDVLRMIMEEFCVGVDYLNLRATCKHFRLAAAAPMIRGGSSNERRWFQPCSLHSPWLLVLDTYLGLLTFTDPIFGDKYFIKMPQNLTGEHLRICYSRYGWLLLYKLNGPPRQLFLFNPFTKDIRELPGAPYLDSLYFSAPPTSPKCMVAGLSATFPASYYIYFGVSSRWFQYRMDVIGPTPHSFLFLTRYKGYVYALYQGVLNLVLSDEETLTFWNTVAAETPSLGNSSSSPQYFLVQSDDLMLVTVDELGESVEVFKLTYSPLKWEKMDSLGRRMIYICGTTCLCMEAKTPEMENKIYFPRLDSEYGKIIFYSLEARRYQTFNRRNIQQCSQDFFGTKYYIYPHVWIEPTCS